MNLLLDDDLLAFRDEVRAFLGEHLTEQMRTGQRLSTGAMTEPQYALPWQRELNKRGWMAPLWPREWGGPGWTTVKRFIFEMECALGGAPAVNPMGIRLVGPVILRYGTQEQKKRFLPPILSSESSWCQGFSEPGAGSDLASLKTRAELSGADYIVNGSKLWTTHAHHANWMFALVRTSREGKPQSGLSFLLIDMKSPGIQVRPIATIGGDHDVNEVFFDDVRVPAANRIGEENAGWDCAKYLLEFERGAGFASPRLRSQLKRVGEAVASLQRAGGQLPSDWPLRFGEVVADIDVFEMMELRVLGPLEPGQSPGAAASSLKLQVARLKQAVAELGFEMLGSEALRWRDSDLPYDDPIVGALTPEYANSRAYSIFGGAREVQLGLIARSLMGA